MSEQEPVSNEKIETVIDKSKIDQEKAEAEPTVESKEALSNAKIEDFNPDIIEKAQNYMVRVSEYEKDLSDGQTELSTMDANDPDRPLVQRKIRQAEKEQSIVNAELKNADDNLLRAERRLYNEFIKDDSSDTARSTPEMVIGAYDDKFARLEASIAEANTYIEEHRKAYGLNTMRAYEDPVLGPKMKERDSLNKELDGAKEAWLAIGGAEVDKAREMVAVKQAFDQLVENSINQDPDGTKGNNPEGGSDLDGEFLDSAAIQELLAGFSESLKDLEPYSIEYQKRIEEITKELVDNDKISVEDKQLIQGQLLSGITLDPNKQNNAPEPGPDLDDDTKILIAKYKNKINISVAFKDSIAGRKSLRELESEIDADDDIPEEQKKRLLDEIKDALEKNEEEPAAKRGKLSRIKDAFTNRKAERRNQNALGTSGMASSDHKRTNGLLGAFLSWFGK